MHKANLVLHCGGREIEREALEKIEAPAPTQTWYPIPHSRMLSGVEAAIKAVGLHIVSEAHAIAHEGAQYFGLLQLANGNNPADYSLVAGIRNSTDKSLTAGLAVGSTVFVCDNLAFSADIVIGRKHTMGIERDLPMLIQGAVQRLGVMRTRQDDRILAYKKTEMNDAQAHDFVVRALDAEVVKVTRIPKVLKEWREPRHPEFAADKNVWRMMNAFTEVAKEVSIFDRAEQTQGLHALLDQTCGLTN